ncbi:hypothetical protein WMY93_006480 [Mugilogobius chulae]|uniref:Signal peptidase complex subunit 3 n=1 Tax=Mugilogobius chulae TaxID=88201 RepID=A0AAW0PKS3_9GOBI
MYTAHLWRHYRRSSLHRLNVAYNDGLRMLLRVPRWSSASQMFVNSGVPTCPAVLRRLMYSCMQRLTVSMNKYATKNNALNQVVLWDKIVLRGENTKLNLRDMKSKYFFFDDGNGLRANKNITLSLSWNVVPNAGILPLVAGHGHISLPFPDIYETPRSY